MFASFDLLPFVQTQLLEELLIKEFGGSEDLLLAELQFAFIAFLVWTCQLISTLSQLHAILLY